MFMRQVRKLPEPIKKALRPIYYKRPLWPVATSLHQKYIGLKRRAEAPAASLRWLPALWSAYRSPAPLRTGLEKRILMLTTSTIEIDPRINKVAESLATEGYSVDILCASFDLDAEIFQFEEVLPGVRYVRTRGYLRDYHSFLPVQSEMLRVADRLQFDFIHANDFSTLATGWLIARRTGCPFIYDAHEMWSENVVYSARKRTYEAMPLRKRLLVRMLEAFFLKGTDIFFTVSPSIVAEYRRRHRVKPTLLANFPDVERLTASCLEEPPLREQIGVGKETFITLYQGGLGPSRNIETVIHAHAHLPERHIFVIRGPGAEHWGVEYMDLARHLGIENRVFVLPPVYRDAIIPSASGADCGIVMLLNISKNFYWFYPNKFFEYSLAGLPVAVSNFPDVAAHIRKEDCGVLFDPADPLSIAASLRMLGNDRRRAKALGQRGYKAILRQYNWSQASHALIAEYERVLEERRA